MRYIPAALAALIILAAAGCAHAASCFQGQPLSFQTKVSLQTERSAIKQMESAELPGAIRGWTGGEPYIERLLTASEDMGTRTHRVYTRTSPPGTVEVMLAEGQGFRGSHLPEAIGGYEGVFSADTDITLTEICGRRAMTERHPLLPLSLSVELSSDAVLVLESSSAGADELMRMAEEIIKRFALLIRNSEFGIRN